MAETAKTISKADDIVVTERDVLFECPSCGKSLLVDQAAEGLIVVCPQCHITVIVPPKGASGTPAPGTAAPGPAPVAPPKVTEIRDVPPPVAPASGVASHALTELR